MNFATVTLAILFIGAWVHGLYSTVQMYRNLKPGIRFFRDVMADARKWYQLENYLTETGLRHRRNALYSTFIGVGVFVLLVNIVVRR